MTVKWICESIAKNIFATWDFENNLNFSENKATDVT